MKSNFHWIQWIQGISEITETWIRVSLKILSVARVSVALWYHLCLLWKRSWVRDSLFTNFLLMNHWKTPLTKWMSEENWFKLSGRSIVYQRSRNIIGWFRLTAALGYTWLDPCGALNLVCSRQLVSEHIFPRRKTGYSIQKILVRKKTLKNHIFSSES